MWLTPEWLTERDKALGPGIALEWLTELWCVAIDEDGYRARGRIVVPSESCPLLVVPITTPGRELAITPAAWWSCLWHSERAAIAARQGNWEAMGRNIDLCYGHECTLLLPPDSKRDLAYAAVRAAGAWGGRPTPEGCVVVAPPERHNAIRQTLRELPC